MNILSICPEYIPSVILCGDAQLNYLKENNKLNYKFKKVKEITVDDLIWLDVIYVIRGDSPYILNIVKWCKKHHKIVLYIMDDNLLEVPSNLSASHFYLKKSTQKVIRKLINISDGFISPSIKLIKKYSNSNQKTLQIIEPGMNKIEYKGNNDVIKIGFAGSIDHGNDIDLMLTEVLKTIKNKYQNKISIEIFGPNTKLSNEIQIVEHPFLDSYIEYQKKMNSLNWDIGLAPLKQSEFNSYKHYNKLVEYESFGIAGIYSNVEPYTFAVKNNFNGLLIENDYDSWVNAISTLIENAELRNQIISNCVKEANTIYSLNTSSSQLFDYLKTFELKTIEINPLKLKISFKWWKLKYLIFKVKSLGFKAPTVIFKKIFKK